MISKLQYKFVIFCFLEISNLNLNNCLYIEIDIKIFYIYMDYVFLLYIVDIYFQFCYLV